MDDATPDVKHPRRSFAFLLLASFIWMVGLNLYLYFIGLYLRSHLAAGAVEVGSYSAVLMLSSLLSIPLGGPLADRFGEKPLLVFGWISILPAPLIYLFAPTWQWTLLGAACEGTGMVAAGAMGSYISRVISRQQRGLGFSVNSAAYALAGIPGPTLGGLLITHYGYSAVFLTAATLFVVSTLFVLCISPVPRSQSSQAKATAGHRFEKWTNVLSNRVLVAATALFGVVFGLYYVGSAFAPLFLADRFGLTEWDIGLLGTVVNASAALFGPLLGLIGDRWGHSRVVTLPVLGALGFYGLLVFCTGWLSLVLVYILYGLTTGLYALLGATISRHLPQNELPYAFTVFEFAGRLFTPVAPLLGGIGYAVNPALPLVGISLLLPLPLSLVLLLHRQVRHANKKGTLP
jgi:MFS family permease